MPLYLGKVIRVKLWRIIAAVFSQNVSNNPETNSGHRSSTDREDEKRYLRRDEDRRYNKRRDGRDRDMRSYYDYNRDERRRREEEEEDR